MNIKRTIVYIGVAAVLCLSAVPSYTFGVQELQPPVVRISPSEKTHISPGIRDGVRDELAVTVSVEIAVGTVIKGYGFIITDSSGHSVKEIEKSDDTAPSDLWTQMLIFLGLAKKSGMEIPKMISWDGEFDSGALAPDGEYKSKLVVWDDRGLIGESFESLVIVDSTPPHVEVSLPYSIFSPNADGNKDILVIEQSGSPESLWEGVILDEQDQSVIRHRWEDGSPDNFSWDGKGEDNEVLPDGNYTYKISATDEAGNTTEKRLESFTIDTTDTPLALQINRAFFSPNTDGNLDSVSISIQIPVSAGIKEWKLTIADRNGKEARLFLGTASIPDTIDFNGCDEDGNTLSEGRYRGFLEVMYLNGNNPTAQSPEVIIDLTSPTARVNAYPPVFSPNGDGKKDNVTFNQETSEEDSWEGTIRNRNGEIVKKIIWRGKADLNYVWDGKDENGDIVHDGVYSYHLSTTDRAGNFGQSNSIDVEKDTRDTQVALTINGVYFSPNFDEVKDKTQLVPELESAEGVEQLVLTIFNEAGNPVRRIERQGLLQLFEWNGFSDRGSVVPDGRYKAQLEVWYRNGNNPKADAGPFVVDTIPPSATISADRILFSPDGDGRLDDITIKQRDASKEEQWGGEFVNDGGNVVKRLDWNGIVADTTWDGKDEHGNRIADGIYSYRLRSSDRAGNSFQAVLQGISVDTRPTPLTLRIDHAYFSPNDDGKRDIIRFIPVLEIKDNIDSWHLTVRDHKDNIITTINGENQTDEDEGLKEAYKFDGKDDQGRRLPEGEYRGFLTVLYKNGKKPEATSPMITLDLTLPSAILKPDYRIFSPNGDGNRETADFRQATTKEELWTGEIINDEGEPVRHLNWHNIANDIFVWDGRGDGGKLVADGLYSYTLYSIDKAGNVGKSNTVAIEKDSQATPISLSTDSTFFSPNGDGVRDTIRIVPELRVTTGIVRYSLLLRDTNGNVIAQSKGEGGVPTDFEWNGYSENGRSENADVVPDGAYTAELEIEYRNGNKSRARSSPFFADTVYPNISVKADYLTFSPDADGERDTLTIYQSSTSEDLWEWIIFDAQESRVAEGFWKGKTPDFSWDGRDSNGNSVADGFYTYRVSSSDKAGNRIISELGGIEIDARATAIMVTTSRSGFSPNGDGFKDNKTFYLYASVLEGMTLWELAFVHTEKGTQKVISVASETKFPIRISWDGKAEHGQAEDGLYFAEFSVKYVKGNYPRIRTPNTFRLDSSPPMIEVMLDPLPFSPDGDGVDDTISIALNTSDVSSVDSWNFEVIDPKGNFFTSYSGTGEPRPILWDGLSKDGELVQAATDYAFLATVKDELGNEASLKGDIPVDVLVIREGEKLKIQISSINFAPYTADFISFDSEKAQKNLRTIDRLAEILQKFSEYGIRIEGHAVEEYWENPMRAKQEEEEELIPLSSNRAEAVKQALFERGIDENRMTTAGLGGYYPIVPHSDLENRWKNRRVEFILIKD